MVHYDGANGNYRTSLSCSGFKEQSTMAMTIQSRASRQVSGSEMPKLPRSMVCGPSTWFEACLRGYLVWTWNSEFGVQQGQTEQDTIGSQTKEFARSSRGCPITGSRVFILESPSCGHLSPAVVWARGSGNRHPQILSRHRNKAEPAVFSSHKTTKSDEEATREEFCDVIE
jgi:hypothetical protein